MAPPHNVTSTPDVASAANESPSESMSKPKIPKKKRSKYACICCRRRKVRCDVWESHPCSNCKHFNIGCDIPARKLRSVATRCHKQSDTKTGPCVGLYDSFPAASYLPDSPTKRAPEKRLPAHDSQPSTDPGTTEGLSNLFLRKMSDMSIEMQWLRRKSELASMMALQAMSINQLKMDCGATRVTERLDEILCQFESSISNRQEDPETNERFKMLFDHMQCTSSESTSSRECDGEAHEGEYLERCDGSLASELHHAHYGSEFACQVENGFDAFISWMFGGPAYPMQ